MLKIKKNLLAICLLSLLSFSEQSQAKCGEERWDVFISYTWGPRNDDDKYVNQQHAIEIHDLLENKYGLNVWIDVRDLKHGQIHEVIVSALKKSSLFLSIITREYAKSKNCMDELALSKNLEIPGFFFIDEDTRNMSHREIVDQIFGAAALFLGNKLYYTDRSGLVDAIADFFRLQASPIGAISCHNEL